MPRFRIQSNLHLDGFQMLDACLENVTSFEGLSDRNTGRIVFLNGSSSNKSNLHPAVYYDNEFKGLAYLDDIDKITNGEGSLGTRVKALEDMLNVDSAETVVSTWEEIQAFLDNVKEGTDLMTMLDGKLDKKVGDNEVNITDFFTVKRYTDGASIIKFANNSGTLGYLGANSTAPVYLNANGNISTLIHSGNIGSYAFIPRSVLNSSENVDSLANGVYVTNINDGGTFPQSSNIVLSFTQANYYRAQMAINKDAVRVRCRIDSWYDWKTIAFTDSTVEAANRLANKVSLWGNEFDGTQSLSNSLILDNNKQLRIKDSAGVSCSVVGLGSDNNLLIGGDLTSGTRVYNMYLDGYKIYFRTGAKQTAMTITDGGNVLVGDTYGENVKFTVKGGASICTGYHINSDGSSEGVKKPSEINKDYSFSIIRGYNNRYGLHTWIKSDGQTFLQSCMADGKQDESYALNLNPLGGAVNVGSVGNTTNILGAATIGNKDESLVISLKSSSNSYIWDYSASSALFIGLGNLGGVGSNNASLAITPYAVFSGYRNEAVDLGLASYRWRNVYSVGGNFSGRVLIGGAVDDENYALNVKGAAKFKSTDWHTESTVISYSGLSLYGRDSGMYVQGLRFYAYDGTSLGHIGFYNGYFYIGKNQDTPWFYINSTESCFDVATTFNGGALIPTGQKLTIGDANGDHATIEYDSIAKAIKVDGNLFTTGTNASGGVADAQQGGTGGNAEVYKYYLDWGEQVYEIQNVKGDVNVNVQVYEWNENGNSWDMILTDVSVTANIITVTFGRTTSVKHMVTVV